MITERFAEFDFNRISQACGLKVGESIANEQSPVNDTDDISKPLSLVEVMRANYDRSAFAFESADHLAHHE